MTAPDRPTRIAVEALDDGNRAAVIAFTNRHQDRPQTAEYERWRYQDCPTMQATVAMAGRECIATMFALRRSYRTTAGERVMLEPFEWHASEDWRAQAPGLRLVKHYMRGDLPLIAVAGTDMAAGLLVRLKWTQLGMVERFALPLSGRYLAGRGRSALVARIFDVAGRAYFTPRRVRRPTLSVEPAGSAAPAVAALVAGQRRFALMRVPDAPTARWLLRAPASLGAYLTFHARLEGALVGWVSARVFPHGSLLFGELLEVFLADHARAHYRELVAQVSATLAGFGADVLTAATTCPDTIAALRASRFRPDDRRPAFVWWGDGPVPEGPVLIDGAISDHAFFPQQTAERSTWLEGG